MDARLRREPQLLILHQLLEPTGLLGMQKSGLVPGGGRVSVPGGWLSNTQQLLGHIWSHWDSGIWCLA